MKKKDLQIAVPNQRGSSRRLLALSTTALALPGISMADAPPTQSTIAYKFSNYQEDDLSRRETLAEDRDRYDVDVHQLSLIMPTGRNTSIQIDANQESMSGASPWFTTADSAGDPLVNLSGASGIRDNRREITVGGSFYMESSTLGASVGYSIEDDYRSRYAGVNASWTFNRDLTTLGAGFSYAMDDVFPSDAELFNRVDREDKRSASAVVSLTQVINQTMTAQTAISFTDQAGFLSDPYKLLDVRPDDRTQLAWSNALRKYFIDADAALHFNYRYYHDDYGVNSHTLELSWYQNVTSSIQVVPHLRYYTQSAADFYTNVDNILTPLTDPQSSDYRLSGYGAFSGGINLLATVGDWNLSLNTERYIADEKYSAFHVSEPGAGLVRYFRVSLGIDYSF